MNIKYSKAILRSALFVSILVAAGVATAATTVNLTAQRATATMPDGIQVPMWQFCGGLVASLNAGTTTNVACSTTIGTWSPGPTITVPAGDALTINLTNSLQVPTSIVVLGQLGGGLGVPSTMASPTHPPQTATTFVGNGAADPVFVPPPQTRRVSSFATEIPAGAMATLTWFNLKPGTYIYETGTLPSLEVPMGLYGLLIVTTQPVAADPTNSVSFAPGTAYPGVNYDADVALLLSEIDPVQNKQVDKAAQAGTSITANLRFNDPACGVNCFPAAVNYTPTYFLVNGQAFDKSNPAASGFAVPATSSTGNVLIRFANAGSRTHIPVLIGAQYGSTNPVPGFGLLAEDGNLAPGNPKVQTEVLLTAGKTHDAIINPAQNTLGYAAATVAVFDRKLSLSTNNMPDGGMRAYLQINGGAAIAGSAAALPVAVGPAANADTFYVPYGSSNVTLGNVLANDIGVNNPTPIGTIDGGLTLDPSTGLVQATSAITSQIIFTYCGNGATAGATCAIVTVTPTGLDGPLANADVYASPAAVTYRQIAPGVLANDVDPNGLSLTVDTSSLANNTCGTGTVLNPDGSFIAKQNGTGTNCSFTYKVVNSVGVTSNNAATVTVNFPSAGSGVVLNVLDAKSGVALTDYRWIIQQDQNFPIDPAATPSPSKRTLSTSFYWSHMPVIASGCVGAVSCGTGQSVRGVVMTDAQAIAAQVQVSDVTLDPSKRYYISILPGDAANPVGGCDPLAYPFCVGGGGHIMGGGSILANNITSPTTNPVMIRVQPTPIQPAQTNFFVYEDNNPANGQYDLGERGLGGFQIILNDTAGRAGDVAGQQTYDAFNYPMTNALLGTPGCPDDKNPNNPKTDPLGGNLVGSIYTCPNDPNEGTSLADPAKYALAGHAVIKNITPARYDIYAKVGAEREGKGERWIQIETLEGTPAIDDFVPGRDSAARNPANFVWGMPGFQNTVGFINPDHVKQYAQANGLVGTGAISGRITLGHDGRPPDITIYDLGSRGPLAGGTACQIALNSVQGGGPTIAYAACDADGNFRLDNIPAGVFSIVVWDQWLDQVVQQVQVTVVNGSETALGNIPVPAWFTYMTQNIFIDSNGNGVRDPGEAGISNVPLGARYRNGAPFTTTLTDSTGNGTLTEVAPLLNWVVFEADTTRYKQTGVEVIVDAGGPLTGNGISGVYQATPANPTHCDPTGGTLPTLGNPCPAANTTRYVDSTGTLSFGVQGAAGQTNTLNWGRALYASNENGGILGTVVYSSTRPFDDQRLNVQTIWEPLIPRVKVNLYHKVKLSDGTINLVLEDTTFTSSFDDWANLVSASDGKQYILGTDNVLRDPLTGSPAPIGVTGGKQVNMQCPGQVETDPLLTSSLMTQTPAMVDQFRCYDGAHNWNQVQKAPYDGRYKFPSDAWILAHQNQLDPNCTNPAQCKTLVSLPPGEYVVEAVTPPGYEIVKEEDKNILIGDAFVAPAVTQFGPLASIFILPDQATLNNANPNNPSTGDSGFQSNPTTNLGSTDAGVSFPECVGSLHRVPDFLSLYPQAAQVAPFAGMDRPLCDRKLVKLGDQVQASANFFMFTPVQGAANGAGVVTDDTAAQFSVGSPTFGDKGTLSFAAVSIRDFTGMEIVRTYADQWGYFNLMSPSSWLVNPPTPSGFGPNMLISCMNDPGPIPDPTGAIDPQTGKVRMITDPQYDPAYMNSCYPLPFMPMQTTFLDTPTLPKAAFAAGYNPADCEYPDASPAILRVDSSAGKGPYLGSAGGTLTITALGDIDVQNPGWAGPLAVAGDPSSLRTIKRHYGFGADKGAIKIGASMLPAASIATWNDTTIVVNVPPGTATGQLLVTTAKGNSTVESVTVTIENTVPKRVPTDFPTIQAAIDAATPGDMIMIDAGSYNESVIMWKPVRLQGVGARSVFINSAKFPVGPMEAWEINVNKLFGVNPVTLAVDIAPPQVDPLPGQSLTAGIALLSPTVLTNVEGPGITVLAKNLAANQCAGGAISGWGSSVTDSNFLCKPSRIDGLSVVGSEGGGGIYVNGWAHNLEISNNRVVSNASPFFGGIGIGQQALGLTALPTNNFGAIVGLGYDKNINIHNNSISKNGAIQPQGAGDGGAGGGLSIAAGTDNYVVDHNFVCGNFTQADGGGIGQVGFSVDGAITNNTIVFNQSFQQTTLTNGGGIAVVGEAIGGGSPSLGTGTLTIDANLIRGNIAETGNGGGISLAQVNGGDVQLFPNSPDFWFAVRVTNNMIDNNVAGVSGGGISLADALRVYIVNNTVSHNDSIGTAGAVVGQNLASPAGISSIPTSPQLTAASNLVSPISNPTLTNDIVWKNRSFYFDQAGLGRLCSSNDAADPDCRQLVWQTATGQCTGASTGLTPNGTASAATVEAKYWDLGVLGDASAAAPGLNKLAPTYSLLTSLTGYPLPGNISSDPLLAQEYCNGSRTTPEFALPNDPGMAKSIQVAQSSGEGGNAVNVRFGPLSMVAPMAATGTGAPYVRFGEYHIGEGSPAIDAGTTVAVTTDFDGEIRPQGAGFDIGADEVQGVGLSPTAISFGSVTVGTVSNVATPTNVLTLTNPSAVPLAIGSITITGPNFADFGQTNNCGTSLPGNASCTITVTFTPQAPFVRTATLSVNDSALGSPQTVALSGTGLGPIASLAPVFGHFGNVKVGTGAGFVCIGGAPCQFFALTNNGNAPLTAIQQATITNPVPADNSANFNVVRLLSTCGPAGNGQLASQAALAPGASCLITVQFRPLTTTGVKNASLSVGDAIGVQQSGLDGTAWAAAFSAASITGANRAFGNVAVNGNSTIHTFTLTNTSTLALAINSIVFGGADASQFSFNTTTAASRGTCFDAGGAPMNVPAGGNCTINVRFHPTSAGAKNGQLIVTDTDPLSPQVVQPLTGTGQ